MTAVEYDIEFLYTVMGYIGVKNALVGYVTLINKC